MKATALILEPETEKFIESTKGGTPIYKLTPQEARKVLEQVQSMPVAKPQVKIEEKQIPGPKGNISIRIVRPQQITEKLPVLMFFHGAGWVMGSAKTHDRLVSELAAGANAAAVFVDYPLSPEAHFPIANEQAYAATQYIAEHGKEFNLDSSHLIVAGDSVGGNMAIAVTLLAKERRGPKIDAQLLSTPSLLRK